MNRAFWMPVALLLVGMLLPAFAAERGPGTGPWDVKALQKAPVFQVADTQTVTEKGPNGDVSVTLSTLYYQGEPWMGKPTRVFAYYARPKSAPSGEKLPAMVLVHGGGGTAFPQWARIWAARGYAALAMDLAGCGPERKRLSDGGPDQGDDWKFLHMQDGIKNVWSYYAVAAVIRGASLLRTMPDVDRNRVGITGISWGGYLTNIVMSLDDRLKVAIPVYGCGFLHENSVWLPILAKMKDEDRRAWIENFDPSRYLPRCKMPVLWVNGTNDFAYPLDSYQKSYRATKGPRVLCITIKMPHGHEQGWAREEIYRFADAVLRGEIAEGLAMVGPGQVGEGKISVPYESNSAIANVHIHWTTDLTKPWQEREWKSATGTVDGLHVVKAELPKERPAVYFLTLTDARGGVVSTEHQELK